MQRGEHDSENTPKVQMLLSQKRELQMQLEREESEKHELFSQINQLIGELDELKSATSTERELHGAQVNQLNLENEELKRAFAKKEAAFQRVSEELGQLTSEAERRMRLHQLEKSRMDEEISDCHKEIKAKEAALQSLNLAKQTILQLRNENERIRRELAEKDDLFKELTESSDAIVESLNERGQEVETLKAVVHQLETEAEKATPKSNKCTECGKLGEELENLRRVQAQTTQSITKGGHSPKRDGAAETEPFAEEKFNELTLRVEEYASEKEKLREELNALKSSTCEKTDQLKSLESQSKQALLEAKREILRRISLPLGIARKGLELEVEIVAGRIAELMSNNEKNLSKALCLEGELRECNEEKLRLNSELSLAREKLVDVERHQTEELRKMVEEREDNEKKHLAERDRLEEIHAQLRGECEELRIQMQQPKKESNRCPPSALDPAHSSSSSSSMGGEEEMPGHSPASSIMALNRRVSELTSENVRLASDLLKQQTHMDRSIRDAIAGERSAWGKEKTLLEARMAQLQKELNVAKSLPSVPVTKPRTLSPRSQDSNEKELKMAEEAARKTELEQLKSELERQKRIVTVLRKKLHPQLMTGRVSSSSLHTTALTSSGSSLTLPRS